MGFIRTTIEFALLRDDLREGLLDYLTQLLQEQLHRQAR
jgi:hypothetical protein